MYLPTPSLVPTPEPQRQLSADLALARDDDGEPGLARDRELADLWTTCSDAGNFLVLGDPAVRARVVP